MLNSDNTVPLILLSLVIILIITVIIIIIYIKNTIRGFADSINTDFTVYKNELMKQNDVLAKQLLEQQQQKIVMASKSNNEELLVNTFVKIRSAIKENCILAMNDIKAGRLAIYLFHNGTRSTHGIDFLKISCICEKIAIGSGVRERIIEHTNIPINLFDEMIDKMIECDRYIIMNDKELEKTNHRVFVSSEKVAYTQLVSIYDINNNILGFIAAEMVHPYNKNSADKEKESLDELVKQLVPILSYSEYVTMKTS